MSSCQSTSATSTTLAPVRSEDPAWAHARVVPGARNNTECLYCNKVIRGGRITRLKYHLVGIPGNVEACKKVSEDVKWQMKELLDEMKRSKEKKRKISSEIGGDIDLTSDDIDDSNNMEGQSQLSKGKGKSGESGTGKSVGGLSRFFAPRTTPGAQPSIKNSMCSNEMLVQAKMVVARSWSDSNLPFNTAQSKFYQSVIDAMTAIGPGFKGPSLYELRGNLLKMTVNEVQDYLQQIKKIWNDTGCTLMVDGWTNQKQQSIINFLVYRSKGTMFLKSVDTSGLRKDAETLFNIFNEVVQEIGAENLVQFITDNDASYKAAGKKLQQKYGSFYWSPCAAYCIDLMLENFSDPRYFPLIDDTIKKVKKITKFIYNHGWVLALMRQEFTKGHDLCRPAITSEPLVRVLRLVDGDEKLAMGYLYDAMEIAKENIKARCNNQVSIFSPFTRIIDSRWDKQLHSPLHAAGCLLNPGIFYSPALKKNDVVRGFNSCVMKIELDPDDQDKIIAELDLYNNAVGEFGHSLAICQRDKLNPEWVSEESELLDGENLDWASIEEPLISLNEEDVDNVGVDADDGGDIDENILINMLNLDPYCLFDEDE
ncbi:uncharacterized protein LOC122313688 [Carya illinoinensis]|uniref:uncharacterized protein LOC122313688 n=1 Tax=Carya illinoinensis TaxID=32201 RepID=UPI001C72284A|nr:uncharacterized protein LOC122313688 [Carya illinoinensis]